MSLIRICKKGQNKARSAISPPLLPLNSGAHGALRGYERGRKDASLAVFRQPALTLVRAQAFFRQSRKGYSRKFACSMFSEVGGSPGHMTHASLAPDALLSLHKPPIIPRNPPLGYAAIHPRILDAVVHRHRKRLFARKGHRGFPIRATTSEACLITRAV